MMMTREQVSTSVISIIKRGSKRSAQNFTVAGHLKTSRVTLSSASHSEENDSKNLLSSISALFKSSKKTIWHPPRD